MKRKTSFITAALFMGSMFCASAVSAQDNAPRPGRDRSPEDMAKNQTKRLKEQLNLSEEQEKSVYDINLNFAKRLAEAREAAAASGGRPPMDSMRSWNQSREAAMKKTLTPEQFEKLKEEREKAREQMGNRRQGGGKPE